MNNKSKKYELITQYLVEFLRNELYKTGLKKAVMGLSGGVDSAVVALLAHKAFGTDLHTVMMPSHYSSSSSIQDAQLLVDKFKLSSEIVSIAPLVQAYESSNMSALRKGNFSARMRMSVLFDISARDGALVLGTSNKSELMLGYGTLFGDLASAINPVGDLYKTEVYALARYLGVNSEIVDKAPSADLYEGQSDEKDLGYSYDNIDAVLKRYVDQRATEEELLNEGFEKELIGMVIKRIYQNQFKRKPPVIAKVSARSINHDFLYPRDITL